MEPKWLTVALVKAIQLQSAAAAGGSEGLRDEGLLESALDRPRNLYAYGSKPAISQLAAAYCAGIIWNHPFIDGNKRTGLLAAVAFLDLNGYAFRPDEAEAVKVIMALAAGEIGEDVLADWISDFSVRKV